MVDPVQSSNMAKLRLLSGQSGSADAASASKQTVNPVRATDTTRASDQVSVKYASELAQKGPPFDVEKVSRIKEAVAEGQYPLDFQRLSETIFQDYSATMR